MASTSVVSFLCLGSSERGSSNSTHFGGAHTPVEEPSTASEPDSCTADRMSLSLKRRLTLDAVARATRIGRAKRYRLYRTVRS
jgi:hypothetical protein